jgi:hypothetical protein
VGGKLAQPRRPRKVCRLGAVVVDVVYTHVTQAVDLATHAHEGSQQIVVTGRLVGADGRPIAGAQLQDRDVIPARRISRGAGSGGHPQRVGLTQLHQPGGVFYAFSGEVVSGADSVVGSIFRWIPICRVGCGRHQGQQQAQGCA